MVGGYGSAVERDLPKVEIRVRLPLPAQALILGFSAQGGPRPKADEPRAQALGWDSRYPLKRYEKDK